MGKGGGTYPFAMTAWLASPGRWEILRVGGCGVGVEEVGEWCRRSRPQVVRVELRCQVNVLLEVVICEFEGGVVRLGCRLRRLAEGLEGGFEEVDPCGALRYLLVLLLGRLVRR